MILRRDGRDHTRGHEFAGILVRQASGVNGANRAMQNVAGGEAVETPKMLQMPSSGNRNEGHGVAPLPYVRLTLTKTLAVLD